MRARQFLPVTIVLCFLTALVLNSFAQESTPSYRDSKLTAAERAADLLKRMTLEEKVDQLAGGRRRARSFEDPEGKQIFRTCKNSFARIRR